MKKIVFILLITVLCFKITTVNASDNPREKSIVLQKIASSSGEKVKAKIEDAKISDLKQRASTEISRRIKALNDLSKKISEIKKISDADKLTLQNDIKTQIDTLNALQQKIEADTDFLTLKADVKSIISGYNIFAFYRVKISMLVAASKISKVIDNMNIVYAKLQTRIAEQKAQGKDVVALEALLSDMLSRISQATTQYQAALSSLSDVKVNQYPANKTALLDAKAKIKTASENLRKAFQDGMQIRQGLGEITGNPLGKESTSSAIRVPETGN